MDYRNTPSVQIDLDTVEKNIKNMISGLAAHGIAHRPHIKVHKSVYLAKLQMEMGASGITCAKLGEAEIMADGGIKDILIAFPLIGEDKLARYGVLCQRDLTIRTLINSVEGAEGLSALGKKLGKRLEVLIEVDGGINRGGLKLGESLMEFGRKVKALEGILAVGVLYYGGDIYGLKDGSEIDARSLKEAEDVKLAKEQLESVGIHVSILSAGSSFSAQFPDKLKGLTEVRAGNYIFNDGAKLSIGLVKPEDCALRVISTIVTRPDEFSAIIDAGTKTLTSDGAGGWEGHGYIMEDPDICIYKLNEEHGFLRSEKPISLKVGDKVTIIPNHACVIPNLCDSVYGMRNGELDMILPVDARGKNR